MIQMNEFTPTRQHEGLMGDAEAAGFREVGMKFDGEKEDLGAAHRCVVAGETDRKFLHTEEDCPQRTASVMRP